MRPKIRIVNPSSRPINPYTESSLSYNLWELGKEGIDIDEPRIYDEYPLSRGRCVALDEFLDSDCTHMFSFDDDQIFPKRAIIKLLTSDKAIVSGWYLARAGNLGLVIFGRDKQKELLNPDDFAYYHPLSLKELFSRKNPSTPFLIQVDGMGLGCVLVTKEAAKTLKKLSEEINLPIFAEWSPIVNKNAHPFGEDLWFGDFCAKAGLPLYVRTDAYIGHWAAQGFVVGIKHLQIRAMQEGILDFDLTKFS